MRTRTSPATGDIVITINHSLDTGEITGVQIFAHRDDQERAGIEIARGLLRSSRRPWWKRLFDGGDQ